MDWLHWRLTMEPGLRLHSCHIDEIVFERPARPILARRSPWLTIPTPELVTYKNGAPVYKFLDPKAPDAKKRTKDWHPSWPIEAPEPRHQLPELTATYQWRVVAEPSVAQAVALFLEHKGMMLQGPAGTGKTHLARGVIRELRAMGLHVITLAYTHSASHVVGGTEGETVTHFLKSHQRYIANGAQTVIVLDECTLVPLRNYPLIANFQKFLGVRVLLIGDYGQMLPISEMYGTECFLRSERCRAMYDLCGGLRVELTECRRSDRAHFDFCGRFRGQDRRPTPRELDELVARYPWDERTVDVCITLSHAHREQMARSLNLQQRDRARAEGRETVLLRSAGKFKEGSPIKPHPEMWAWVTMPVSGCTRDSYKSPVRNSCQYVVTAISPEEVSVRMEHDEKAEPIALSHHDALQYLRLGCARTAASVQGLTLRNQRLLLCDVFNPHMCGRKLYVAMTRVSDGSLLHVASRAQMARLFPRTG